MNDTNMNNDAMDAVNDKENRTAHNGADNMIDTDGDGKYRKADDSDDSATEDSGDSDEGSDDEGAGRPDQDGQ